MRLKGKVAVITGAGRGIGKATALLLAEEGAKVVVDDIDLVYAQRVANHIKHNGGKALAIRTDVSNGVEVNQMVEGTLERFRRIDILVNNAGICEPVKVAEMSEDEWDRVIDVNLKGTFLCSKAVIKTMMDKHSGRIVNISSLAGKSGGILVGANYAASKGGILAFTRTLAREVASYGITVNAITPGTIDTRMIKDFTEKGRRELIKKVPLGRFGQPEDVAQAVLFLVSKSGDFITGATIDVNGGLLMA